MPKRLREAFWIIWLRNCCDIGGIQGLYLSEPLARLMMTFVGLERSLARCT
jgi:hypothetical protein